MSGKELIVIGYNGHDCETYYKCPFCGKEYTSWGLFHKSISTQQDFNCFDCKNLIYYR